MAGLLLCRTVEVVVHQHGVMVVNGGNHVEQRRQQIRPGVVNAGGVFRDAVQDLLDMLPVELLKPLLNVRCGILRVGRASAPSCRYTSSGAGTASAAVWGRAAGSPGSGAVSPAAEQRKVIFLTFSDISMPVEILLLYSPHKSSFSMAPMSSSSASLSSESMILTITCVKYGS